MQGFCVLERHCSTMQPASRNLPKFWQQMIKQTKCQASWKGELDGICVLCHMSFFHLFWSVWWSARCCPACIRGWLLMTGQIEPSLLDNLAAVSALSSPQRSSEVPMAFPLRLANHLCRASVSDLSFFFHRRVTTGHVTKKQTSYCHGLLSSGNSNKT